MDLNAIDFPTLLTYGIGVVIIVGGPIGIMYIRNLKNVISTVATASYDLAAVCTEVGELMAAFSAAMEDDNITPEEWAKIKSEWSDIVKYYAQCEAVFDTISGMIKKIK